MEAEIGSKVSAEVDIEGEIKLPPLTPYTRRKPYKVFEKSVIETRLRPCMKRELGEEEYKRQRYLKQREYYEKNREKYLIRAQQYNRARREENLLTGKWIPKHPSKDSDTYYSRMLHGGKCKFCGEQIPHKNICNRFVNRDCKRAEIIRRRIMNPEELIDYYNRVDGRKCHVCGGILPHLDLINEVDEEYEYVRE